MKLTAKQQFAHRLLDRALHDIPLSVAMQISVHDYDGDSLILAAPLAPNVNDKGCAFGGSLASLLTLAGWGLVLLQLQSSDLECDIYVQDSTIRYLAPVWSDLTATATLASGESWEAFLATLALRGRARLRVACRTPVSATGNACTLDARFVAIMRKTE